MMDFIEKAFEMRAVKRNDIIDYFIKIGGKETENGIIADEDWETEVGPEFRAPLGPYSITAVNVVFRCKKELFDRMYYKFCLEFFHAGG